MAKKCTRLEKEKRIFVVQGWILDGVHDNLILRQARTQWGLSLSQAKRYLKKATDNWKREKTISIEDRRELKIAELKQELRNLRPEFKGTPQGMNARTRIHKLIIKLEDLEPAKKHKMDATVVHTEMSREERDAYIKEMQEKIFKDAVNSGTEEI